MTNEIGSESTSSTPRRLFGAIAIELGFLTPAQVIEALSVQRDRRARGENEPIGEVLIDLRFLTPPQVMRVLEEANPVTPVREIS